MATIRRQFEVSAPAEAAWRALRDFGGVDRLAAGFVTACALEQQGAVRRITFFNGMEVRERLVTLDDEERRIVYTAEGGRATHYNAAVQVVALEAHRCRFAWTIDLLPDAIAPAIAQMMERGAQAMQASLTPPAH